MSGCRQKPCAHDSRPEPSTYSNTWICRRVPKMGACTPMTILAPNCMRHRLEPRVGRRPSSAPDLDVGSEARVNL